MHSILVVTVLSLTARSLAWGALGHETVALIAQAFVTEETKTFCQQILGNESDTYLADVATWADSYRATKAGKFSAPFHFIDAEDSPPTTCNVDYNRDCGASGCVVSALSNYTSRVMDKTLPTVEQNHALRFIVHFVGDIHQPLHDEALDVGGNTVSVTFDGAKTNLHAAWDTSIPEKLIGGGTESDASVWSKNLTAAIDNGVFAADKASWLSGMDLSDTISSALVWARDTNAKVCSVVMPQGVDALTGAELYPTYYQSTVDTVELQIAKAGYRLAGWLNLIATGKVNLEFETAARDYIPKSPYSRKRNEYSAAKIARREFGNDCNCGKH